MKKDQFSNVIMWICYGILFLFLFLILLRIFTRVILIERLQVEDNAFINALFFDQPQLTDTNNGGIFQMNEDGENALLEQTDWEELYPFTESQTPAEAASSLSFSDTWQRTLAPVETKVRSLTDKVTVYATDFLIGQQSFVAGMNRAEQLIGWNIAGATEYNAVVTLADGRLTEYIPICEVSEHAQSVADLDAFCQELGCEFLYVQSPYAICRLENADICGVFDFSNQNADDLLAQLDANGVDCLDLREQLHADGLNHADAFYRTDHHWKAETGLWAAGNLSQYLNEAYGFSIDTTMLEQDQFLFETYPSWFLGSRGNKLTIQLVDAEDFTMIYPNYETSIRYQIPGSGIDETGDFTVTYSMDQVATTGGYSRENSYGVYNHGDVAVNILQNELCRDGKRILIIKDSFTNVVNPFLACVDGVSEIDVLDVRHFTGSAKTFIREQKPDIVIVWYNPSSITEIDWTSHKSTFDFR